MATVPETSELESFSSLDPTTLMAIQPGLLEPVNISAGFNLSVTSSCLAKGQSCGLTSRSTAKDSCLVSTA